MDGRTGALPVGGKGGQPSDSAPLVAIVGPTAVGKTQLSLELASRFSGAIVSADSRLVYRGLDIGTSKPTPDERGAIPHYLVDICDPDETMTLGRYQRLAFEAIAEVHQASRLPFLVGGTGQFVAAVVEGWGIPRVPPHTGLRKALSELGEYELARWLRLLDPRSAHRIERRNVRRVIRALEVTLMTGRPMSTLQYKQPPPYRILTVGLKCRRQALYRRIDARVDLMMQAGLLDEVRHLLNAGVTPQAPALSGLGYRQLALHLEGANTLEEAVQRIKFETHRYARQQHNWFRLDDPSIAWFDVEEAGWQAAAVTFLEKWISSHVVASK